jgi:hypothetical protein
MSIKMGQYTTRCAQHATSALIATDMVIDDGVKAPIFKCGTCGDPIMSDIADHVDSYFVRSSISYEEHLIYVMSEKTTKRKKV